MSILIKGMDMPKDGVYWCEIGVAGEIATITIHGEARKSFHLVSVPTHGDLIDRDKFRKTMFIGDQCLYSWDEIEDAIDFAPTIIPASEGE